MPDDIKKNEEKKEISLSPEISNYLDEWTKNPKSKIFVKLAEEYRKSGLIEEALHVCEKGLQENPNYLSGNMVIAKIYNDMGELDKSMQEVMKVTNAQSDNLMAQNLLLEIYIKKGDKAGAIRQCDIISYLDPNNKEVLKKKEDIEAHGIVHLRKEAIEAEEEASADEVEAAVKEEFKLEDEESAEEESESKEPAGFATNTIAELYIKQGYYDKGLNIYKELLEESPNEPRLIEKINEIERMMHKSEPELVQEEIQENVEETAENLEPPVEEEEAKDVVYELEDSFDEPSLEIARGPEPISKQDEEFVLDTDEMDVEAAEDAVEPEMSLKDRQIERLENWLGKIQSRGGR